MRPHYYYKTLATTEVGKKLQDFINRCNDASETARQWAEKQGATSYIESPEGMAGGIAAIESFAFPSDFSEGKWKKVESPHGEVFYLPAPDSELEREMYALPIVSESELIKILQFKPRLNSKGKLLPVTFGDQTPVVFPCGDSWYVDVPYECLADGLVSIKPHKFIMAKNRVLV